MKKHLFYSFLLIFVATAFVTLLGLVNIVEIKEGYLDILIGVLIVELAGSVVALFKATDFFSDEITSPKSINTKPAEPTSSEDTKVSMASKINEITKVANLNPSTNVGDYFSMIKALEHRFHELEEFINAFSGSTVSWSGYVSKVSGGSSEDDEISLVIKTKSDSSWSIFVHFPYSFKTKLYSLNKKDFVTVTGTVNPRVKQMPDVDATAIELQNL